MVTSIITDWVIYYNIFWFYLHRGDSSVLYPGRRTDRWCHVADSERLSSELRSNWNLQGLMFIFLVVFNLGLAGVFPEKKDPTENPGSYRAEVACLKSIQSHLIPPNGPWIADATPSDLHIEPISQRGWTRLRRHVWKSFALTHETLISGKSAEKCVLRVRRSQSCDHFLISLSPTSIFLSLFHFESL